MKMIRILSLFAVYWIVHIESHAYFSSIAVDGKQYAEGVCIRPHPSSKYDYPISDIDNPSGLQSGDMTCGFLPNAAKAAKQKCAVNPGSKIDIQWHYEMGLGSSDTFIIDPSHKGPCIVYLAKSETGAGSVWFKIFEDGYDTSTKKWCVDKLRANKGLFSVTIPTDITPGNYLLRAELIALHEGFEIGGAQPYVHCAEITVGGSGTVNPGNLVAFPGAYKANDPGIYFDIYPVKGTYPIPGPKLYVSGAGTGSTEPTSITTGTKPVTSSVRVATTKAASPVTTKATSPVTTKATSPVTTKASQVVTTKAQVITTKAQASGAVVSTGQVQVVTTKARRGTTGDNVIVTTGAIIMPVDPDVSSTSTGEITTEIVTTLDEETNNIGQANGVSILSPAIISTLFFAFLSLVL